MPPDDADYADGHQTLSLSLFAFQADFKIRLVHAHAPVTDRGGKESPTISYYRKGHGSDCRVF